MMLATGYEHAMQKVQTRTEEKLKPESVIMYNKTMGGVDDVDRMLHPYSATRKTVKW